MKPSIVTPLISRCDWIYRMGMRRIGRTAGRWIYSMALGAALLSGATAATQAATVYNVYNHPDGNLVSGEDVDGTGYVLRLDVGTQKNTFNANTIGDLTLTIDSDNNQVILDGHVTHNQSGTNLTAADADDDVYLLHAVFTTPSLTDATPSELWYGEHANNAIYDGILDDLLADAAPYTTAQTSTTYSTTTTRLSFFMVSLSLTPDESNENLGKAFPQSILAWNEFPNDGSRPLLIEYDFRMAGANALGGGGWLETDPDSRRYGTSELLFSLDPQQLDPVPPTIRAIPMPAALPMGLIGLTMLGARRRRRA